MCFLEHTKIQAAKVGITQRQVDALHGSYYAPWR